MFVCAAVSDPRPVFVFRFNGERITLNSAKYALVTNSTHGTLTVFNIQSSDEGTYTCSASSRYGSVSTAAVLTVQGVFGLGFGDWICVAFWLYMHCVSDVMICLQCISIYMPSNILHYVSQFPQLLSSPLLLSVML